MKKIIPKMIISIKISKFKRCCPLKIIVLVINFPDNFPKATRDAVKVIAPINDPKNNSTLCVVEYIFVKL